MDRKSFDKLKNATTIIVVVHSIISLVEVAIEPPYKYLKFEGSPAIEASRADPSKNIIYSVIGTSLYCSIVVCVIRKEHSCLNAFFMVLNTLSAFLGVAFTIVVACMAPARDYAVLFTMMHFLVIFVACTTAGFMIAYYRQIRKVSKHGFAVEPNAPMGQQTMNYKVANPR